MPAEHSDHNLQALSARLKGVYLENNLITLPLELNQQDKEAFPIEKAIDMTFLDNADLLAMSGFNEGAAESLDDIERPTQDANYQRRKITLGDLIDRIEGEDGQAKSILVSGRAGIGKSTLCHLIAHLWAKGVVLKNVAAVIWLPLKSIHFNKDKAISEWIWQACLNADESVKKTLKKVLFSDDIKKCLFILDGYDEVENLIESQPALRVLLQIIKNAPKLITTKPHADPGQRHNIEFHSHVENIGFRWEQLLDYITHYFNGAEDEKNLLIKHIEHNPNIRTACYIPINLFFLCRRWRQQKYGSASMPNELYARFVQAISRQSQIDTNHKPHVLSAISRIAYEHAATTTELHIEKSLVKRILQNYHAGIGIALEDLLKAGFIKPSFIRYNPDKQTGSTYFSFIHPTFQAYFSAKHLRKIIKNGTPEEKTKVLNYISRNKYNPAFATTLPFIIAMVCHNRGNPAAMNALWDALLVHDLDIVGLKQQELMILALECSSGHGLSKGKIREIEGDILNWVRFSIQRKTHDTAINQLKNKAMAVLASALANAPMVSTALLGRLEELLKASPLEEQFHFMTRYSEVLRHYHYDTRSHDKQTKNLTTELGSRLLTERKNPSEFDRETQQPPNLASLKYATKDFKQNLDTLNFSPFEIDLLSELIIHSEDVVRLPEEIFKLTTDFCNFLIVGFYKLFFEDTQHDNDTDKRFTRAAHVCLRLAKNKQIRGNISRTAKTLATYAKTILLLKPTTPKVKLNVFIKVITILKPLIDPELFSSAHAHIYPMTTSAATDKIATTFHEAKPDNADNLQPVLLWVTFCRSNAIPLQSVSALLKNQIQTKNIKPADTIEITKCIEEIILSCDKLHITSDPNFLSIFVAINQAFDEDILLKCLVALIKTLALKTTERWQEQLNAIREIANRLEINQKFVIINELLTAASGTENTITQTDRYADILKTAKLLFTSLDKETQRKIHSLYKKKIGELKDPDCLSIITLLTSPGRVPVKFRIKLTQLLRNPQPLIVGMATALLLKTTAKMPDDTPDEDTLFYVYIELAHGNKAEAKNYKRQFKLWLSQNPEKCLLAVLKAGFYNEHLFKTFSNVIIESEQPIHTLLSVYIQFLNGLSDDDIEILMNEKMYLFDLMLHALQLNGFTLKASPVLGILIFYDHTGTTPYQFNNSPALIPGISRRERAIVRYLLNRLYHSLQENELPSSLIGSLLHFEQPPHEQRSAVSFYDEHKLKCSVETFPFSPYVVKNSPRCVGGGLSVAAHLIPDSEFIPLANPNKHITLYSRLGNDTALKIITKHPAFLCYGSFFKTLELDIKNILRKISYLDLSANNLDDNHLKALFDAGCFTPNIRILKLSHNHLTERSLCKLLQQVNGLRYLFIDNNRISFDDKDINRVKNTLEHNRSLIHLDVSNNFLPTYTMELTPNPRRANADFARPAKYSPDNRNAHQPSADKPPIEHIFKLGHPAIFSAYNQKPIQSILDPKSLIDHANAMICVITKKGKGGLSSLNLIASEHMYLLLEDIDQETSQRRLLRADLFTPDKTNVELVLAQISLHELEESKALKQNVYPFRVSQGDVEKIIGKIQEDQSNQRHFYYAMLFDGPKQALNCSKWVIESLLNEANIKITRTSVLPSQQLTKSPSCIIQ